MVELTECTLTPAYGRDYKSKRAVQEEFEAGKDFQAHYMGSLTYCSIRDAKPGMKIKFRYDKQRKVCFITVK